MGSCPPDLEAVELQQHHQQQQQLLQKQQQQQQQQQESPFLGLDPNSDLVRNLAIAIKTSMETYKGEGTYEPSADELIDVLKNLENLAAINPALYRAIVDQIKVCHSNEHPELPEQNNVGPVQDSHTNGYKELVEHEQEYEQGYSEVDQNVVYEEHYHETG